MVAAVCLDVLGVRVSLELVGDDSSALLGAVRTAWSRCLVEDPDSTPEEASVAIRVFQSEDAEMVAKERAAGAVAGETELVVLDELTTRVVRDALGEVVGDRWLLHACALSHPETGATVVLVAPSGTGKTTASSTLARELGYVTDETAMVERDGTLALFPKPLSLLVDGRRPKKQVSPDELGMLPAHPRPWLAAMALLQRDPEATGVSVEQVPMVEGLAFLAEQTSSLHLLESPLRTAAEMLRLRGGLRRLVYAESAELAPVITQWLEDASPINEVVVAPAPAHVVGVNVQPPAPESAAETRPVAEQSASEPEAEQGVLLKRAPVVDELQDEGFLAVMVGREVLTFSAMASLVLDLVAENPDGLLLADLEQWLEAEVGAPEGQTVSEALTPLLDELVQRRVLTRI